MANDINRLIDMLFERIEDAKSPALKPNMSLVDRDEILDLLEELRAQLPVEIKRAQELLAAREKFGEDAKRDVERMMRQAELEAKTKISESEVMYAAREKARQIVTRAEERSRQLYQVANSYAEDALARTEEAVQAALNQTVNDRAKGVKAAGGGVYLLKKAEIPAILVECGFLSNGEETALLNTQAHQNRLAVTILASALGHLNQPSPAAVK